MTDILADWKIKKFVVVDNIESAGEILIVLTDFNFWVTNYCQLQQWCDDNTSKTEGMTVIIPNYTSLTAFMLKWS